MVNPGKGDSCIHLEKIAFKAISLTKKSEMTDRLGLKFLKSLPKFIS